MYGDYKGYPQEYEAVYPDEIEGNNHFYYDYGHEPSIIMPQQRMNRHLPQYRNQNYINYQLNQHISPHAQPNNFNQNQVIFNAPQRSIHSNHSSYHLMSAAHYFPPQTPINSYQTLPQPQSCGQFIPIQKHQSLIKQYKMTLNMVKAQNNALIQKLKVQIKRIMNQQKMVRDFILSIQTNGSDQNIERFMDNFGDTSNFSNQNILVQLKSVDQSYQDYQSNFQNLQSESNTNNFKTISSKVHYNQVINPKALILQKKIRSLNEKKANQQKIKIQNAQKNTEAEHSESQKYQTSSRKDIKQAKKSTSQLLESSKSQRQQQFKDQQDNLQLEPMYPPDFQGQQSFLVDQEVEAKQKMKKQNLDHPKANTFGMTNLQNHQYRYKPFDYQKNQDLQKEWKIVDEFFGDFLCENITYAPKKDFLKHKIGKAELYNLYKVWRQQNKGQINLVFDKKIIQSRLTKQINRRFASCKEERQYFVGLIYKDLNFYKKTMIRVESISI